MADRGIASRRDCERLIEEGKVTVNKRRVTKLPVFVNPETDDIRVNGQPLPKPVRPAYIILHKPPRTLATTRDDPSLGAQRTTLTDLVDHPSKTRLFPVGRLEYHASGLVLLTTDGELAHRLTHPRFGVPRTYEALVKRRLTERDLAEIEKAFHTRPARGEAPAAVVALRLLKHDEDRSLIEIVLREGPNRQVADVLARLGCPVKKLRRTGIGPIRLKGVAVGAWRELDRMELATLKKAARPRKPGTPAAGSSASAPAKRRRRAAPPPEARA
jgi:23S rRNA pseudouridine2605 synthase